MPSLVHVSVMKESHLIDNKCFHQLLAPFTKDKRSFFCVAPRPNERVLVCFSDDASWGPDEFGQVRDFIDEMRLGDDGSVKISVTVVYDDSGALGAAESAKLYTKAVSEAVTIDYYANRNDRRSASMIKTLGGVNASYVAELAYAASDYHHTQTELSLSMLARRLDATPAPMPAVAYAEA